MKYAMIFSVLTLGLNFSAHAAPQPWLAMEGTYTLSKDCEIDFEKGFNKARLKVLENEKKLEITAYSGSNTATQLIAIDNFQRPASGTDGDVFFAVRDITGNSFVSTEHFVRKGSTSWPDLEQLYTTSLSLNGSELTLVKTYQDSWGKKNTTHQTCVLQMLEQSNEASAVEIENFTDKDLTQLSQAADVANTANMDLDQAAFQIGKFKMNKANPSKDELKEILALHANMANTKIETRAVKSASPADTVKFALKTALGIAGKKIKDAEYQSLRDLRDMMFKKLSLNKANLKVIVVSWSESDADGEGLLLIDQNTGEALYIGSGYFS